MLKSVLMVTCLVLGVSAWAVDPTLPKVGGHYECKMPGAPSAKPEIDILEKDGKLYFDPYFAGFLTQLGNDGLGCENVKGKPVVAADGTITLENKSCTAKSVGRNLRYTDLKKKNWLASILITVVGPTKISVSFQDFPADQNGTTFQMPKFTWGCIRK